MIPDDVTHVVPSCGMAWHGTVLYLFAKHLVNPSGPNLWENWLISQQVYFEAQLPTSFWLLGVWMI